MPRPRSPRRYVEDDDEDDEPDADEEEEEEEPSPRRRARAPARRGRHRGHPAPVRRWRSSEDEEEEDEEEGAPSVPPPWQKKPIYWRARDSLFFEPLVALAIVVLLLVSLFAYTQNWPPVYVVESNSMQHGSADQLGLINAGDLVLAQKTNAADITTYVAGLKTGYSTYGEYGDVILYWPDGQGSTPIVHRAILYLQYDPLSRSYNATDLFGLKCANEAGAVYYTPGTPSQAGVPAGCGTTDLTGELVLYDVGWNSTNIYLDLSATALGGHSGFVTMGDANPYPDQNGSAVPALSTLVEPGWIIGVARGMIPWFGAVKLLLQGESGRVPSQSWELMGLTIVGAILVAFGVHYAFRREGFETPLRREEEEAARAEAESEPPTESAPRRWLSHLHWRRKPEEEAGEDAEDSAETTRRRRSRPPPTHTSTRRGRPVPHVRRTSKPKKGRGSDDEL